jgi:hypothetical protein
MSYQYYITFPSSTSDPVAVTNYKPIPPCGGWLEGPFFTKPEVITRLNALNVPNKRRQEEYRKVAGQKLRSSKHYYVAIPKTGNRIKLFAYKPSAEGYILEGPMTREKALQRSGELEVRYNLYNPKFFETKDDGKEPIVERKKCTGCGKCLVGKGCSIARSAKYEAPKRERRPGGKKEKKEKKQKAPKTPKEKKPVKRLTVIYPTYLEMSRDESYPAEFRKQCKMFAYGKPIEKSPNISYEYIGTKLRPVSPIVRESTEKRDEEKKCLEEFKVQMQLIKAINTFAKKQKDTGYLASKRSIKGANIDGYTYFSMRSMNNKAIAYAKLPKSKKAKVKIEVIELDKDGRPTSIAGLKRLGLI